MFPLYYGQHPLNTVPQGAYPLYGRVGYYLPTELVPTTKSGVARLRQHIIYENTALQRAMRDDEDFMEIVGKIIQSRILE